MAVSTARRVIAVGLVAVLTVSPVGAGASPAAGAAGPSRADNPSVVLAAGTVVPTPARTGPPNAIAVLGDSISAGTGTGGLPGSEQPQDSWATGTNPNVNSLYLRLLAINPGIAGKNYNLARNGADMSDAPGQAASVPLDTEYVVIQMGGNDLCKSSVDRMATPQQYRANVASTLGILRNRVPDALIGLSSIPDIYNLWYLRGAPNPPNPNPSSRAGTARLFWSGAFGLFEFPCQSLLANATSTSAANEDRRQAVRTRNMELNEVLAEECAKVLRCLFDDFETFNFTSNRDWDGPGQPPSFVPLLPSVVFRFVDDDISTLDHFHPSLAGHIKLASEAWRLGPNFADSTAPNLQLQALPGAYRATATDNDAVLGLEYRVYPGGAGGSPGVWVEVPDDRTVISADIGDLVEVRALDVNGNLSASQVAVVADVPGPPVAVAGQRGDAEVVVSWQPPADDGGSAVTGYTVTATPGGASCATTGALSCVVTGLTNGVGYRFTVAASNVAGAGGVSVASGVVTPRTVPGAPSGVSGVPGDGEVVVSWQPPADDGGSVVTGYTVTGTPGGSCTTTGALNCVVTGLTNGTSYTFTVVTTNGAGDSLASEPVTTAPRTVPGAPTGVSARAGAGEVTVSWSAPASDGGSAITGYTVTGTPGGSCTTTGATSCVVTGLTNGTGHTFTVVARNEAGDSDPSVASGRAVPLTVPGAPRALRATPGNARATVSWGAPASNGGTQVTRYQVTASPGGRTCTTGGALSCVVTGLRNGTGYTFRVVATNAAGNSPASVASARLVPRTVPGVPRGVRAVPRNRQATVSWTAPSSDGGVRITGYRIQRSANGRTWSTVATRPASARSFTVRGLARSSTQRFRVVALNAAGSSAPSRVVSARLR